MIKKHPDYLKLEEERKQFERYRYDEELLGLVRENQRKHRRVYSEAMEIEQYIKQLPFYDDIPM